MQANPTLPNPIRGDNLLRPFGEDSDLLQILPVAYITELYRRKCDIDIADYFRGHLSIRLYRCKLTGYRFWRPTDVACDESGYNRLRASWPNYYRPERWEYAVARAFVRRSDKLLEVGCGQGYFLRSIEGQVNSALGIEHNRDAISRKVTNFPVEVTTIEEMSERAGGAFQIVCAFQVLEHIVSPGAFIDSAVRCLAPGGLLLLSTPNYQYEPHRRQLEAFDLPPHHMGHFEPATFRSIARLFGLTVVRLIAEPRKHIPEPTGPATLNSPLFRVARIVAGAAYDAAYRLCREAGPNLIAVLRKG